MKTIVLVIPIILSAILFNTATSSQAKLDAAEQALIERKIEQAETLYKELSSITSYKAQAHYGLARIAIGKKQWEEAEDHMLKTISIDNTNANYYYLAATIAGTLAQESSIFSQLGYAKDVKKYFNKALSLDPKHQQAISGLIQFHMMAPGIAGGDEEEIPLLLQRLEKINEVLSTQLKAQFFIKKEQYDQAENTYNLGIKNHPRSIPLLFQRAMLLNSLQKSEAAIDDLKAITLMDKEAINDDSELSLHRMASYQIAKISAENNIHLELGKKNIYRYMDFPQQSKEVPESWVRYRLGQILFHLNQVQYAKAQFQQLQQLDIDDRLKKELKRFQKEHDI